MEQAANAHVPQVLDPLPVCNHVYPKGRHCRQAVASPSDLFCASHAIRQPASPPSSDPLAELAVQLGSASTIEDVRAFISAVIKLACQNRISVRRATALTYMANSLLNAIRLANHEDRLLAKEEDNKPLDINWNEALCGEYYQKDERDQQPSHLRLPPSHPLPVGMTYPPEPTQPNSNQPVSAHQGMASARPLG